MKRPRLANLLLLATADPEVGYVLTPGFAGEIRRPDGDVDGV